jgi:hypothetical protein
MRFVADHWGLDGRNRVLAATIGLSPLWFALVAWLSAPSVGGGIYQPTQAEILAAQQARLVLFAIVGLMTVAGARILWRAERKAVAIRAIVLLIVPATLIYVFGPAFLLIFRNMT